MKTDQLIAVLAADLEPAKRGLVMRWLALGLVGGLLISASGMVMTLRPRHDMAIAIGTLPFWLKFAYTAVLATVGLAIVQRQARAGGDCRTFLMALGIPILPLVILAAWQLSAPRADSALLVMGHSWLVCPWLILALSLPMLAGLFLALRQLAPTRLNLAGAAAGLVAGAAAATIYGYHCNEQAAPFILIWYTLGIALCTALGAFLGRWALRW